MSEPNEKSLLIIEDDPELQRQLRWCFDGFDVHLARDRESALVAVKEYSPPVVTLDLGLPPDADGASEGLATLEQIISIAPDTKVIMVTGNDDRENAVRSIGLGAYDFYHKPIDNEILGLIVDRAYKLHELEIENKKLAHSSVSTPLNGIIASSPQMLKICRTIERVAPADVTTLLLGESGTGKEVLAKALHALSPRNKKRFVAINCAAIPDALLESELFGYEKGAFTGAAKQTRGKIEYADGGTLFLDEIGDLPFSLQAKLLRFLQERVIERLGGREEIPIDVRVICATHQDLQTLVKEDKFREDLYYRVSEISIEIPSLRERDGDAILLARTFLDIYNKEHGRRLKGFTQDAIAAIDRHQWPGNVRELENKVKRAVIMADGNTISAEELGLDSDDDESASLNLRDIKDEAEKQALRKALTIYNGNVSQASESLGISRPTLYTLMNKYDIRV